MTDESKLEKYGNIFNRLNQCKNSITVLSKGDWAVGTLVEEAIKLAIEEHETLQELNMSPDKALTEYLRLQTGGQTND